jgi:hypothetical protein
MAYKNQSITSITLQLQIMRSIKALMLLTIAFTVIAFSSCKKDNSEDTLATSTITVDIDGTATVFTTNTVALKGEVNGREFTSVQGTDNSGNTMSLTINGSVIAGKTYLSNATVIENKSNFLFTTANDVDIYSNDDASVQSITVTSASANRIEGTFTGIVNTSLFGSGTIKIKSFTNGKFKAAIVSK